MSYAEADARAQRAATRRGRARERSPLLVFAGAGSGKTRTIPFRVANPLANERVPPYRILAVTFINKGAGISHHRRQLRSAGARPSVPSVAVDARALQLTVTRVTD